MAAPRDSVIRPDRLLLATDGSEDAVLAARVATDLSQRTGARLHVAHAWYHLVKGLGYPTLEWAEYSNLYEQEDPRGPGGCGRGRGLRRRPSASPSRPTYRRHPRPLRGAPARSGNRGQPRPRAGQTHVRRK